MTQYQYKLVNLFKFSVFQPTIGTNPLSVAAPGKAGDSFQLDMATSAVAFGKVCHYNYKESIRLFIVTKTTFPHHFLSLKSFFYLLCVLNAHATKQIVITSFSPQVEMCRRKETEIPQGWGVDSKGQVRDHVIT